LIDNAIEQGHMNLINDLAYPLPITVIAELLGIPSQDQDTFKKWADDLLGSTRGSSNNLPTDKDSEKILQEFKVKWIHILTILFKREERKKSCHHQAMI
jgi:cytochrome P450